MEGYSVRQLCKHSGHSKDKIFKIINYWLGNPLVNNYDFIDNHKYLIFDGTFLYRPVSLIGLMTASNNSIIAGKYGVRENSEKQLISFFRPLKEAGLSPLSFTVDGNPQAIKMIKKLWPDIIIQRCLVHIQRQGLMWCRTNPKRPDAKKLRDIFLKVTHIKTKKERNVFVKELFEWEQKYGKLIKDQPERGRVFSDLKRARSMLLKALPNMFHYLDNPDIPNTTNALEGYFSRLKSRYRSHRGLEKTKRANYFDWYFKLCPR